MNGLMGVLVAHPEKTVGKLDDKRVIFGRKFLKENPQYTGVNALYEKNRIIFVDEDPDALTFMHLAQKYRMLEAGWCVLCARRNCARISIKNRLG